MHIAQLAPLYESVPPRGYGGTERVVSYLTEELTACGHEVTLFASADSLTSARLVPGSLGPLRLDSACTDPIAHHLVMLEEVARREGDFDVIHAHLDHLTFPYARRMRAPVLTTLHGRLDLASLVPLYSEYCEQWVTSISDAQRAPLPWLRWAGTVHHGLPHDLYSFHPVPEGYLAFVGRISAEKRVDRAIEIAVRADRPLRIAAKVDPADGAYYDRIRPLLGHPLVDFVGEIGDHEKDAFIGGATALLFPIDWPEPFGLAMIEAMACGTPVIAWAHGSVPEIVTPSVSGFICEDVDQAVDVLADIDRFDRRGCRAAFERRFTAAHMATAYLALYEQLIDDATIPMRAVVNGA